MASARECGSAQPGLCEMQSSKSKMTPANSQHSEAETGGWLLAGGLSQLQCEKSQPPTLKNKEQKNLLITGIFYFQLAWMFSRTLGCPGSRMEKRHLHSSAPFCPGNPRWGLGLGLGLMKKPFSYLCQHQGHLSSSPMSNQPSMATARPLD